MGRAKQESREQSKGFGSSWANESVDKMRELPLKKKNEMAKQMEEAAQDL
jgi:hypothetical protein